MPVVEGRSVGRTIVVVRKPVLKKRYRRRQAGYRRCRYMASEGTIGLRMSRRCGGYGLSSAGSTGEEEGAAALGFAVVFAPCVFVQSGAAGGRDADKRQRVRSYGCRWNSSGRAIRERGRRFGRQGADGNRCVSSVLRPGRYESEVGSRRKLTCDSFARGESYSLSAQRSSGNLPVQR